MHVHELGVVYSCVFYIRYHNCINFVSLFLPDVIGRVHELGDVQTVQVGGEDKKRVQFRLVDTEFVF